MTRHGVAVIGTGYIGAVHIEQLMRLPQARVIGIADADPGTARSVAERFAIPKVYSDVAEAIADREVQVIHNCTPSNAHFEISRMAIEAGKEVLSEKPLALTSAESAELVRLSKEHGTVTGINFCYRYYPVVQEAAVRAARGDIGEIYCLTGSFFQDWLLHETDYSWRLDPAMAGSSNIIGDLGSHWCDLAQFITGLKITEVMAELMRTVLPVRKRPKSKAALTFYSSADTEYEDVEVSMDEYGSMLLRFENGATGTFTTCQLAAGRKADIEIQVYGSEGSLAWSQQRSPELWLGHRDQPNQTLIESPILQADSTRGYAKLPSGHPMGYMDAVCNLFSDFYQAVDAKREGREFKALCPDFGAGHAEMLIVDAAVKSAKAGSWIKVNHGIVGDHNPAGSKPGLRR